MEKSRDAESATPTERGREEWPGLRAGARISDVFLRGKREGRLFWRYNPRKFFARSQSRLSSPQGITNVAGSRCEIGFSLSPSPTPLFLSLFWSSPPHSAFFGNVPESGPLLLPYLPPLHPSKSNLRAYKHLQFSPPGEASTSYRHQCSHWLPSLKSNVLKSGR